MTQEETVDIWEHQEMQTPQPLPRKQNLSASNRYKWGIPLRRGRTVRTGERQLQSIVTSCERDLMLESGLSGLSTINMG